VKEIEVKVVPKSSKARVEAAGKSAYKVWVHSAPEKGLANKEVRKLLARHFGVPASSVVLIKGEHSRIKTFRLDTRHYRHNIKDTHKED